MHVILFYHIYSTFSLLSNVTFFLFSLLFPFQLAINIFLVTMLLLFLPYSWVLFLIIPQLDLGSFPFLPLFSPTILSTVGIQPTPITYQLLSFDHVLVGSIPLRSFSLFLTKNSHSLLGKCQSSAKPPHTPFPKMVKVSINSLCPHPLACIRWFLTKDSKSSLDEIPKLGPSPPPLPNHTICTSAAMGLTPLAWLGCRRAKPKPYLTHLPFYSCLSLILASFSFMHCLLLLLFIFFHRVSYQGLVQLLLLLSFYTKGCCPL